MKKYPTFTFIFLCLILVACIEQSPEDFPPPPSLTPSSNSVPPTQPAPAENEPLFTDPFTLDVGRSVYFNQFDLTITFESVESDSRCPSAVNCVQNGPVIIIISATQGDAPTMTFEVNPDPQMAQLNGIPSNIVTYRNFQIQLTAVNPYPEQPEDILNLPYAATFILSQGS